MNECAKRRKTLLNVDLSWNPSFTAFTMKKCLPFGVIRFGLFAEMKERGKLCLMKLPFALDGT